MLMVKARAKPSLIHGVGLFAEERIPRGTVIWKFDPAWDLRFTAEEVERLPEHQRSLIKHFAYFSERLRAWVYSIDDSRFINHSPEPNQEAVQIVGEPEFCNVANRDMEVGEELTEDYRASDAMLSTGADGSIICDCGCKF